MKSEKIEKVCALIENNYNVLGSTGVEDNLQDGVVDSL